MREVFPKLTRARELPAFRARNPRAGGACTTVLAAHDGLVSDALLPAERMQTSPRRAVAFQPLAKRGSKLLAHAPLERLSMRVVFHISRAARTPLRARGRLHDPPPLFEFDLAACRLHPLFALPHIPRDVR